MCTHLLSHCGKPVSWVCGEFFVLVRVHHIVLARKHILCLTIAACAACHFLVSCLFPYKRL